MSTNTDSAELLRSARDGEAEVGERVTVIDLTTGAVRDYRLVPAHDADAAGDELSVGSRLGSALVGRHVGDVVEAVGNGHVSRLEVVEIDG